jgi:hypothetical protein
MYAKSKADILPAYKKLKEQEKDFTAYLKKNTPKRWRHRPKDDKMNRIGDILLIPNHPKVFNLRNKKISIGWHGYDPYLVKDMHASFYAWGPAFQTGLKIPAFENIHIYPLLAEILDLKINKKIDGKKKVLRKVLEK